jgi:amidohydrolase family protein
VIPLLLAALLLQETKPASAPASAPRPPEEGPLLAIRVKRAETVSQGPIEGATILVQGGRIATVGPNVPVSRRAKVVEAGDLVAVPGWVIPWSRLGMSPGRARGSNPHLRAMDELDPHDPLWRKLLERGATTIAVAPYGGGISGRGAILRPRGSRASEMALVPDAFLAVDFEASTPSKQQIRQALQGAERELEKLEKAAEDRRKAESRPASAPSTQPSTQPATRPAPETRPAPLDPKVEPLVRLLERKTRALVALSGPGEYLHFRDAVEDFEFDTVLVVSPMLYQVADRMGQAKETAVLPPDIRFEPQTRNRVNAAAILSRAGVRIAFAPSPPTLEGYESYPFLVGEVVKAGLPRDVALRAMTLTPAELLGVADRVGSIEEGKDANLLFFDGDPLDARARLRKVLFEGEFVFEAAP